MKTISRRDFLKVSGTTAAAGVATAAGVLGASAAQAADAASTPGASLGRKADLPKAKGARVVVVGGGWAGLTVAKYLRKENPNFDVVLIERRALFMSCPISNLWLAGVVNTDFITKSYLEAAKHGGYTFFNATVVDVDRTSRKVYTEQGYVDYDYLVLAPGIDYNYESIGVTDPNDVFALKTNYPAGFIPGSEHLSLKKKLEEFESGVFLLTVPPGNYRCLPGPYERACIVASIFKKNKIKGKVVVLDANPDITIKKDGFHNAFDTLYKGVIEYHKGAEIESVNVAKKQIQTKFDTFKFDDAAIYPRIRASRLIEQLGLANPESPQKEANIDVLKYNIIGDERVYVLGDARPMPFSKSGNTANSEGKYVAKVVAAHAQGKQIEWESPHTICYSGVAVQPLQSISVDAQYKYDPKTKAFGFDKAVLFEKWDKARGEANLEWARGLYRDMFG
jgi:sulfide dehydrogenase [flavocytochrome c] flavoprotein subunit